MCKQKVGRVKSAKFSFSKVLCGDCGQLWARPVLQSQEGRPQGDLRVLGPVTVAPHFHTEAQDRVKGPLLYLKPESTLLIPLGFLPS